MHEGAIAYIKNYTSCVLSYEWLCRINGCKVHSVLYLIAFRAQKSVRTFKNRADLAINK